MCLLTMGCDQTINFIKLGQRHFITCHRDDCFKSRSSFFRVECHVNCAYNDDVGLRGREKCVTRHERMEIIGFSRVHRMNSH